MLKDALMTLPILARGTIAASLTLSLVAATTAMAQDAKPAEQQQQQAGQPREVALKADPSQANWVKICGNDQAAKKEVCFTQRSFVTETNQPIVAMAVYDTKGAPQKFIRFIVPLGFMLERGMRYTVDKDKPVGGKFQVCMPNGCFAEVQANEAVMKSLKGGKNLKVEVQNQLNQVVAFMVPLEGFAAAFDGPAIDPKAIEAQNKKLEAELAKKLEDQKKLLEQQSKGNQPAANPQ
jgi:invasion protein IalB